MPVPHGVPWDKMVARPPELARGLKEHLPVGALCLWSLVAVRPPRPCSPHREPPRSPGQGFRHHLQGNEVWGEDQAGGLIRAKT